MKRILRLSALAGLFVTTVLLTSLAPVSPQAANGNPLYRSWNGGHYYRGGYARDYGGYSGFGYSPYGQGGYTYVAPRAYVYPSYGPYGYGARFENGASYNGINNYNYGGARFYGQRYRPVYTPYGYGGYGQFGY